VGEALPFEDRSLDVVLYSNSLHHVPLDAMRPALAEAARALEPGGLLHAMEPLAVGAFHDVMSLWNDETEVRARAYEVLEKAGEHGFEAEREVFYAAPRSYADYADFAAILRRQNAKNAKAFAEMDGAIRARFDEHARAADSRYVLDMSYRVNLLRRRG
jgi:ubiquinone/menaquinone biosynthesis C-methylase UbiE